MSGNTRTFWVNPDPNLRHGTYHAYNARGCRCDDCLDAWRVNNERRKRDNPEYLASRRRATQRWRQRQLAERIAEVTR